MERGIAVGPVRVSKLKLFRQPCGAERFETLTIASRRDRHGGYLAASFETRRELARVNKDSQRCSAAVVPGSFPAGRFVQFVCLLSRHRLLLIRGQPQGTRNICSRESSATVTVHGRA